MNMKALILGIIFLAAALIVPAFALYEQATTTMKGIAQIPELATDPTGLTRYLNQQAVQQETLLAIVLVVEVVLVACFAVSFWYAIKCTNKDQCRNFAAPA
jgi:hypothetical protein